MWKCENGHEFEEFHEQREYHGLDYGYETFLVCPVCGAVGAIEDHPCEVCGEGTFNDKYCDTCLKVAKGMLKVDFKYMTGRVSDLVDLFTEALDEIYVEDRYEHQIQRPAAG